MRLIDADELEARLRMQPNNLSTISVIDMVHTSPTIEKRKTGKWKTNSDFPDRLICGECSAQFDMWHWEAWQMRYCPYCGAKMEGAEK